MAGAVGMNRALGPLTIPQYRWFLLSTLAGSMAFQSQQIAMGWLAYDLTKSPFALGLVLVSWGIPEVAFSLVGGVIADSRSRRQTMAIMTVVSGAVALAIATLLVTGQIAFWHLLVGGLVSGAAISLNMPSRQAFVFDLVGPEHLGNAIAINSGGMNIMRLLSPALSGFLIGAIGVDAVYYLVVLCYAVSALTLVFPLNTVPELIRTSGYHPLTELAEGFRYIRREKTIFWLLVVALTTMFVGLPFRNLMPAFVVESLGQGPQEYGLLMSMVGLGAILGSIGTVVWGRFRRRRLMLMVMSLGWGLSLAGFGMSGNLVVAVPLALFLGLTSTGSNTLNNVLIQSNVEHALRGRVLSFYMLTFGLSSLGTLPLGSFAELAGTATALIWSGLILTIICVPLALWGRKMLSAESQRFANV